MEVGSSVSSHRAVDEIGDMDNMDKADKADKTGTLWKLTLCYDGALLSGWQVQPGRATVQGLLAAAIARVTGEQVLPQGSGRTDAGVHALAQVASFSLTARLPPTNLIRALNHALPPSVRVLQAEHAAPGFHARHSALSKTYEYRILRAPLCPPWSAPYLCHYTFPLDLAPMHAAAASILGTRDFRSFQAHDPDREQRKPQGESEAPPELPGEQPSTTRTIFSSGWHTAPCEAAPGLTQPPHPDGATPDLLTPTLLIYRVRGSGFLHHMVRNLVGTFLAVGRGQLAPDEIPRILAARSRAAAGPTAPAHGLYLHHVEYPAP